MQSDTVLQITLLSAAAALFLLWIGAKFWESIKYQTEGLQWFYLLSVV